MLSAIAVLFLISEAFPPWLYEDRSLSITRSAGYHFYFSEPPVRSELEMKKIFGYKDDDVIFHSYDVRIDYLQLFSQRLALFFLMIGLWFFVGKRSLLTWLVIVPAMVLGVGFAAIAIVYQLMMLRLL